MPEAMRVTTSAGGGLFPQLLEGGARAALSVEGRSLSASELAAAVRAHGARLRAAGVEAGDRVAVWAQGAIEAAVALVGNAVYGAVSVPLNPRLGARELDHVLADARPRAVLAADVGALGEWARREPLVDLRAPALRGARPDPPALADDAPLLVLYTSGTTGAPKGAVLTLGNLASDLDALAAAWQWSAADTVVHALPIFHVHGLVLGLFGALRAGGGLRWLPRFEARALAAAARATPSALVFAVPTMIHRLAEEAGEDEAVRAGLAAARLLISGSAALSLREHQRIAALCGRGVHERYGLTETLINCAVPASAAPEPGRVGPPLPGVELRLVDEGRGEVTATDDQTIGEVAVRGPNVFAGYLNRPEATAAVLDGAGWFYTGDLATRRADGSIRIVGRRATDLIKSGGFKIGAGEIEGALLEHPAVAEAAVLGAPDPDLGERIVAFVVARAGAPRPSEAALAGWVAELLAPHKRPRAVVFVEALPRNAMGKVQKGALAGLVPKG